jgi:hypothetical protein
MYKPNKANKLSNTREDVTSAVPILAAPQQIVHSECDTRDSTVIFEPTRQPHSSTIVPLVMQMAPNMQNSKDHARSQHSPSPFFPKKNTVDKGTSVDTRSYKKTEINTNLRAQHDKKSEAVV